MESLTENTLLFRIICVGHATNFLAATELFPPLNDTFEMSAFPDGDVYGVPFGTFVLGLMLADTLGVVVFGKMTSLILG